MGSFTFLKKIEPKEASVILSDLQSLLAVRKASYSLDFFFVMSHAVPRLLILCALGFFQSLSNVQINILISHKYLFCDEIYNTPVVGFVHAWLCCGNCCLGLMVQ